MKSVCLCGSTKFKRLFEVCIKEMTKAGIVVLYPDTYKGFDGTDKTISEKEKTNLQNIHFEKIKMADCVLILNPFGYIGESTKNEIEYAKKLGKKIFYFDNDLFSQFVQQYIRTIIDDIDHPDTITVRLDETEKTTSSMTDYIKYH